MCKFRLSNSMGCPVPMGCFITRLRTEDGQSVTRALLRRQELALQVYGDCWTAVTARLR